jgi:hypothetical protein
MWDKDTSSVAPNGISIRLALLRRDVVVRFSTLFVKAQHAGLDFFTL